MTEQIKKAQKQWAKQNKKLLKAAERAKRKQEAKGNGEDDGEGKEGGEEEEEEEEESDDDTESEDDESKDGKKKNAPPPMVLFFQPITLEELVNMVLNLAEYPTFSMMMRMKAQQIKVCTALHGCLQHDLLLHFHAHVLRTCSHTCSG